MICALGLKFINGLDYAVLLLFGHSVIQRKGENGLRVIFRDRKASFF